MQPETSPRNNRFYGTCCVLQMWLLPKSSPFDSNFATAVNTVQPLLTRTEEGPAYRKIALHFIALNVFPRLRDIARGFDNVVFTRDGVILNPPAGSPAPAAVLQTISFQVYVNLLSGLATIATPNIVALVGATSPGEKQGAMRAAMQVLAAPADLLTTLIRKPAERNMQHAAATGNRHVETCRWRSHQLVCNLHMLIRYFKAMINGRKCPHKCTAINYCISS
jgi:hypothetical protein